MAEKIVTAEVTTVAIGHLQVEGLLGSDGRFYIAAPQVSDRFSVPQKNLSRDIKSLMGKDFQFLKIKTKLNPKAINALTLADFERLVAKLDRAGNQTAQDFRDDLAGLSLHQLFADAFGLKFEAEERQAWLRDRQEGKKVRRTFTDAIKAYLERHPELSESRARFMYSNASDQVNKAVFGRIARILCRDFQADKDSLRDCFVGDELRHIAMIEEEAMYIVDRDDKDPCDAVLLARSKFSFDISSRPESA